jgi:hypothetical protein
LALNRKDVREIIIQALASDTGCDSSDFAPDKFKVAELRPDRVDAPYRRQYETTDPAFHAVTTGEGSVACASVSWLDAARDAYEGADRDGLFDQARLSAINALASRNNAMLLGPFPRFVGIPDAVKSRPPPTGYRSEICDPSIANDLDTEHWSHAIGRRTGELRPLTAIALTWQGDRVAGVATLTMDSEQLWQIGIDVDARDRGLGLGAMMTAALGLEALSNDAVPYYGTTASNVASMRTALSAGFRPAWVEAFTKHSDLVSNGWLTPRR